MPEPNCPAWCDRSHAGFDATTSAGAIAVAHTARRGDVELGAIEYLEPDGSHRMTTLSLDLPNSADDLVGDTPADLAADLRRLIANLAALADALDDGEPAPRPEPIPVIERCVVVGWRWPDGEAVEFDDDGEPVRSPQHGGSVEA